MIRSELKGAVRVLTLERPEVLNAFNTEQFEILAKTLIEAGEDSATKVVVLTGAGRAFSAGADLAENRPPPEDLQYGFQGCIDVLINFRKPLILAINGVGVGIGATICGLADLVFMAESARLRCPFSALGLTAEACSTYTFPRLMGPQPAASFLLGAGWLSASQCKASGPGIGGIPQRWVSGSRHAGSRKPRPPPVDFTVANQGTHDGTTHRSHEGGEHRRK